MSEAIRRVDPIRKVSPTPGAVHISRDLTDVAMVYTQEQTAFVADRVFPVVTVDKKFDQYYIWGDRQNIHGEVGPRAPGARARRMDMTLSKDAYHCEERALASDIPWAVIMNADMAVDPRAMRTVALAQQALLDKETELANLVLKVDDPGATWTLSVKGATAATAKFESAPAVFDPTDAANNTVGFWDDDASEPIKLIRNLKTEVQLRGLRRPNKLYLTRKVFDVLIDHPDFLSRINQGQTPGGPAVVNAMTLAAVLEMDELLISDAVQDTADEGVAANRSFIGGDNALLLYSPMMGLPSREVPSAGYTFHWNAYGEGVGGAEMAGFTMTEYPTLDRKIITVEIDASYDQKITGTSLAVKLNNLLK